MVTKKLIGEAVTKSTGEVLRLFRWPHGGVEVSVRDVGASYTDDELKVIGDGDVARGIMILAQREYHAPRMVPGTLKWMPEESDAAKD